MKYKDGDIITRFDSKKGHCLAKVLRGDQFETQHGVWKTYHLLFYSPVLNLPLPDAVSELQIQLFHAPIAADDIDKNWELFCTGKPATLNELRGFLWYLKDTDFGRYLRESGQDITTVVAEAKVHYQRGCMQSDNAEHEQAVESYSEALECFPLFYEALDNRAFAKMALHRFEDAIEDFQRSMKLNPKSPKAIFATGRCFINLNRPHEALPYFEQCASRWPEVAMYQKGLYAARKTLEAMNRRTQ